MLLVVYVACTWVMRSIYAYTFVIGNREVAGFHFETRHSALAAGWTIRGLIFDRWQVIFVFSKTSGGSFPRERSS